MPHDVCGHASVPHEPGGLPATHTTRRLLLICLSAMTSRTINPLIIQCASPSKERRAVEKSASCENEFFAPLRDRKGTDPFGFRRPTTFLLDSLSHSQDLWNAPVSFMSTFHPLGQPGKAALVEPSLDASDALPSPPAAAQPSLPLASSSEDVRPDGSVI